MMKLQVGEPEAEVSRQILAKISIGTRGQVVWISFSVGWILCDFLQEARIGFEGSNSFAN